MGKHSSETVLSQVREIEAVQEDRAHGQRRCRRHRAPARRRTPQHGQARACGLRHPLRNLERHRRSEQHHLPVNVSGEGALQNPVLVVSSFSGAAAPGVTLDGAGRAYSGRGLPRLARHSESEALDHAACEPSGLARNQHPVSYRAPQQRSQCVARFTLLLARNAGQASAAKPRLTKSTHAAPVASRA